MRQLAAAAALDARALAASANAAAGLAAEEAADLPPPSARSAGSSAVPLLRQVVTLLLRAEEAAEADVAGARAAAAKALAHAESSRRELEVAQESAARALAQADALRQELEAAREAGRCREQALAAELEAERGRCHAAAAEAASMRAAAAAAAAARAGDDSAAQDEPCQRSSARMDCTPDARMVSENVRLRSQVQTLGALSRRQACKIQEHEARLRTCAHHARSRLDKLLTQSPGGSKKRRRPIDGANALHQAVKPCINARDKQASPESKSAVARSPLAKARCAGLAAPSNDNPGSAKRSRQDLPLGLVNVPGLRVFPRRRQSRQGAQKHTAAAEKTAAALTKTSDLERSAAPPFQGADVAATAAGAAVADAPNVPDVQPLQPLVDGRAASSAGLVGCVSGALVAADVGPPPAPFAVRAEGRAAAALVPSKSKVLCRCVVRGRDARMALQGFDCEQCRAFYQATGIDPGGGLKSSRHRYQHPPKETPPGFWDLSFPQGIA